MKTLLLIVDMQNDFCKSGASLYVNGAENDAAVLADFISGFSDEIDHIILTQDSHQVIDISHPCFWEDSIGNPPPPFTIIKPENIRSGEWRPRYEADKSVAYVGNLEKQGEFPHTIWPEHCIIGSEGAAIISEIMEPVKTWARKGNFFDVVVKGTNPLTEHFGVLRANIPVDGSPETQLNLPLISKLNLYDHILIAGEAKSHCVANTVKQMIDIDRLPEKLVLLEDCMSDVEGFGTIALPIYERARRCGVTFSSAARWFR
jgi:nicotinamidase/pyrazinamidase